MNGFIQNRARMSVDKIVDKSVDKTGLGTPQASVYAGGVDSRFLSIFGSNIDLPLFQENST